MRVRELFGPVAASAFAGVAGAGLIDWVATAARGSGAPGASGSLFVIALGLYGAAGLLAGPLLGLLVGGVGAAIPDGPRSLREDEAKDRAAATGILAAVVAASVVAVCAAFAQGMFISKFESRKLAVIAAGGIVLLAAPLGGAAALALLPFLRRVASALPRPRAVGATGALLLSLAVAGTLAGAAALSRADWRVLDLGPLVSLAAAVGLGVAHAFFWYGSNRGRSLRRRVSGRLVALAAGALAVVLVVAASTVPETSPAWAAVDEGSLGLRTVVRIARRVTDGDGDGFSARFGGGDCDGRRAEVFPGAEDVPGDGVDQNCEGGDARPLPAEPVAAGPVRGTEVPPDVPPETAGTQASTRNILIVTVDALRADRLGVAGYRRNGRSLTPHLDQLARRGAYFTRVWAQAPNTPRSFPSILTSRWPSDVAWEKQSLNYSPILASNQTVFEELAAAGLKPIGIFSHFYFTADRGISQGFAEWSNDGAGTIAESNKDIASPRIVPRVIERLKRAAASGERFVLWTHLFEPHSSYMAHRDYPTTQSGVPGLLEKYDYEIAFVDGWIGKLLGALDASGLARNTTVVLLSDHGEAWGEHRKYFHGEDLFEEQIRVPLIVAVPGRPATVIDQPVSNMDLAPTLSALVGRPPPAGFRGRNLLPLLTGGRLESKPVFAEILPSTATPKHIVAMIADGKKLIHRITDRRWELFDLASDPGEKKNLAADPSAKDDLDRMRSRLVDFEERRRR